MTANIESRTNIILDQIKQDPQLNKYVNSNFTIPKPYHGTGEIKLIVIGQDPTVKDENNLSKIKTVLNLDKTHSVWAYLAGVCNGLGISLKEHVFATNLLRNFFVKPPTQIIEIDIFKLFSPLWLPLLIDELNQFGDIPVISLGEPILATLINPGTPAKVRYYWGYVQDWTNASGLPFDFIRPTDNKLNRNVFPFPHQPSLRKKFYRSKLPEYTAFMKSQVFQTP